MNLIEEFEQISKPIQFNREEYFYHAFSKLSEDNIKSYLTEGIKSPLLLKKYEGGNNGYFYVSLSKIPKNVFNSSFYCFLHKFPMFIINPNIKTVRAQINNNYDIFIKSPLPFRKTQYIDEYQKFLKVNPIDIIGIEISIKKWLELSMYNYDKEIMKMNLLKIKSILEMLQMLNLEIPVLDYSEDITKKIDKSKSLELVKKYTFQ